MFIWSCFQVAKFFSTLLAVATLCKVCHTIVNEVSGQLLKLKIFSQHELKLQYERQTQALDAKYKPKLEQLNLMIAELRKRPEMREHTSRSTKPWNCCVQ